MTKREITVGGAQLGPIAREESRQSVVGRMLELMRAAHAKGCDVVVYPELSLTSFFPRWWIEDEQELDSFFEPEMPGPATRPLFEEAGRLGMGFYLGYAELVTEAAGKRRYNTAILVDKSGVVVGKYRKVHLPGHADRRSQYPFQHLEKRYFEVGDLGFETWRSLGGVMGMCLCNDRRWPETYRVLALHGAELVMLGYNIPASLPWVAAYEDLAGFHNHLCMQAGAYQNGMWIAGVAKAGMEEGCNLIGGSCIIAPSGEIVALARTKDDELITAVCDLNECAYTQQTLFNFAEHRRIEHYAVIANQTGVKRPGGAE